jgi:hypothetical protein
MPKADHFRPNLPDVYMRWTTNTLNGKKINGPLTTASQDEQKLVLESNNSGDGHFRSRELCLDDVRQENAKTETKSPGIDK